ncbi:hypothetical protein CR513_42035, partial [Mucuna pruriens]
QNSNVVGFTSLIDNLYMFDVISFYNKILQTSLRDDYSRYGYLYLIDEKSQSLDIFKFSKLKLNFKVERKLKLPNLVVMVNSMQCPGPFALFLKQYGIIPQYTMPDKPSMNNVVERRKQTLKDMVRRESLKIVIYILFRVSSKAVNKTLYELWTSKRPSIKHLHIWGCPTEARPYRSHERKLDLRIVSCYFVGYVERSSGYMFYDFTLRSLFEMGNEVEFEKEENIRNVVFVEESINDISKVLVPITIQETTIVIEDNVQTIILNITMMRFSLKYIKNNLNILKKCN